MSSLTHAIHVFQSGGLSSEDFLAQIDRALASEEHSPARLLEILSEEHTRFPLPADVYAEVQRRIEHRDQAAGNAREATRVHTERAAAGASPAPSASPPPGSSSRDASPSTTSATAPAASPGAVSALESERVKGVGDTLNGRFVLEECLGFGGMGTVYKALDLRKLEASDRNPYIAIKVLNVQFRSHPKSFIALQREAKKAQTLAHPNIVAVYDFDRDGTMVYLTMEYIAGQPLNRLLRAPDFKGMPYAEAMKIVGGMAKALSYAHERGFVHCDFKPANVLITDRGEVKVIDFGIARVFQRAEEDADATVFDPGSLGGLTPAYASPEMLEHREPDPRDDIYALGCIAYELLTGRHPFDRMPATEARAAGRSPQRPPGFDARQWRALKCALCFDREQRTPTVARFVEDLMARRTPSASVVLGSLAALAVVLAVAAAVLYRGFSVGDEAGEAPPPAVAEEEAASPSAAALLAAVTPVLDGLPCSALAASVRGGALRVEGFLGAGVGLARLQETLAGVPGVSAVDPAVQTVGDEKCAVIQTFAPYWRTNRQAGAGTMVQPRGGNVQFTEGDRLILDLKTPAYDSYVSVDYFVLDGTVIHLVPSPRALENQAPPNHTATIGSLGNWTIAAPFGAELIVLLATPVPVFAGLRPEVEPGIAYLKAVEAQLAQIAAQHGAERITADFVQIDTRAKNP